MIPSTTATVWHTPTNDIDRFLPEGPRLITWRGQEALAWVNIQTATNATSGAIHVRTWDCQTATFPQPRRPGFLMPTDVPDTLLVGMAKEVGTLHLPTNTWTPFANTGDDTPRTIINDGEIVPGGRAIVFGTKDVQFAGPIAKLYLYTVTDRRCTVLSDGMTCSNGKVFHEQGEKLLLYDIDTPRKNVIRYSLDLASRQLSAGEVVLDLQGTDGFPDGMVDGGDGSVLIAFYHPTSETAGHVRRYDLATGAVLEEWRTPQAPRVTCPLLIARNGVELFCTTCTEGMPEPLFATCPNSGNLFHAKTGLRSVPTPEVVRLS